MYSYSFDADTNSGAAEVRRFRAKSHSYTRPMRFVVVGVLGVVLLAAAWGLVEGVSGAGQRYLAKKETKACNGKKDGC